MKRSGLIRLAVFGGTRRVEVLRPSRLVVAGEVRVFRQLE
jgi:hypothetical protein